MPRAAAASGWISDVLSREGSLWLESAFCKDERCAALLFSDPLEVVTLSSLHGLKEFFQALDKKLDEGYYLAGWLSYEAGFGFEPALFALHPEQLPPSPLGWFGVYREPMRFSAEEVATLFAGVACSSAEGLSHVTLNISEEDYAEKIRVIKDEIAAGNLYQVNFTARYRFSFTGSAPALFCRLRDAQPSSYTAFLKTGERTILSFSPELFFSRRGEVIETMPMKGTAPRGGSAQEDRDLKEQLGQCTKNLAENLMIVDLLRNDLGRICKPGRVETGELFATETYLTLHQMVSTIRGELQEGVGLLELFRALYPSGSITGAPKIRAMQLIRILETEPRGVYTGTIGFMTPQRDMVFNVAIRTAELSAEEGVYGSGSGIVWDSSIEEEYRECQLKSKILDAAACHKEFELFETMLWSGRYLWLEEHFLRLASSAASLGFTWNKADATLHLTRLEEEMRSCGSRFKVRLTLFVAGACRASFEPITVPSAGEAGWLALATHRTDSGMALLYHKTTERELYDRYYRRALEQGYGEVLFLNERGEVTEGAISTIFIRKGNRFFTPPLSSGLLNGIFRRYFLSTRPFVSEKTLMPADLLEAGVIYIANSVRGIRPALFRGDQITL